jgi:adenine-specific DNA methylase
LARVTERSLIGVVQLDRAERPYGFGELFMQNTKRLIEVDFPLEQVSLDSVHEKNVRHGHISTLHIWPARRPLAACRAALIATLLPDPGNSEERRAIYRRLAGEVVETIERKKVNGKFVEKCKRETRGGILHWGRENGPDLNWFRQKIREAYGGRAPSVLDPFAGGGAIPLEAMRLGCEATAVDINPVAWFILKCTLEYPQKLAGQTRPLPVFALKDRGFLEAFLKAKRFKGAGLKRQLAKLGLNGDGEPAEPELIAHNPLLEADLAWQVRAWGRWVLAEAKKRLAHRYPSYAEFQALEPGGRPYERLPLQLLEPDESGNADVTLLNAAFPKAYLDDPRNPRWVGKPTVAYLWARTVRCKGCRATIPLLKTRWLAKKDNKRVLLTMTPNAERTGVVFGVEINVPMVGGNPAQRREHDKRRGAGTMTRSGAQCPCCPTIMTSEDIRLEGGAGRLGMLMTAVVVDGLNGKEYRTPTTHELDAPWITLPELNATFAKLPFGLPDESVPLGGSRIGGGSPFTTPTFGLDKWAKLFTSRQLLSLGTLASVCRRLPALLAQRGYSKDWVEALAAYVALVLDKTADYGSALCTWHNSGEKIGHTFARFALPIVWDIAELAVVSDVGGAWIAQLEWVGRCTEHCLAAAGMGQAYPLNQSATAAEPNKFDVIVTDPPYYDAIPYSDLMDFFYLWLRRTLKGIVSEIDAAFAAPLGPKWDHIAGDGELIDDASRFGGDNVLSKKNYEDGMARAFRACHAALKPDGLLVLVFANKQPDAWETLVGALIRSGFVVDGSWPIQTEMGTRTRAMASAALASSVWLVCRKRPPARPGFDTTVLAEMRARIHSQLRAFWDASIRGPDFVWAATGPALEAYSKYPVVKKAGVPDGAPNALMTVSEFLREVRRIVVDFVVGRVLSRGDGSDEAASLDDVTTYYLLHRNDFGFSDAPIGACILYALSCNLSDGELAGRFDILTRTGGDLFDETDGEAEGGEDDEEEDGVAGRGNKVRLKPWNQRRGRMLGLEAPGGRPVPLIDQAHRLMHLWRAGDQLKVDAYLDARGLKRHALFAHLLQALIELAAAGSDERAILESLSNHIAARGGIGAPRQIAMPV